MNTHPSTARSPRAAQMTKDSELLNQETALDTFADFARSIPERWRKYPVYLTNGVGVSYRILSLCLAKTKDGQRCILLSHEHIQLRERP